MLLMKKGDEKMRISKRLASFAVGAVMFISALPMTALAHDGQYKIFKGSFSYYSDADGKTVQDDYYYSDAYFSRPADQLDEHLKSMSFVMAVATRNEETEGNVYDVLEKTGFDKKSMSVQDMEQHSKDTIGTIIAHKKTSDGQDLVAVAVNGLHYKEEWENNVTVGTSGDAEGFSQAAKKVTERILKYEQDNDLKGAKLWLTGYSRAGAVCDLAGKYINEQLNDYGIGQAALYDYAFAVPGASAGSEVYKNIHDTIDRYDAIPRFLPADWGIGRAGTQEVLANEKAYIQPKVFDLFGKEKITDETKTVTDPETGKKTTKKSDPIDLEKFLDEYISMVAKNVTRERFDSKRDVLPEFISVMVNSATSGGYTLIDLLRENLGSLDLSSPLILPLITLLAGNENSAEYRKAIEDLPKLISDTVDGFKNKDKVSEHELEVLKKGLPAAIEVLIPAIRYDFVNNSFSKTATLIGNIGTIIAHHYPENYFKELKKADSYYTRKSVDSGTLTMFKKVCDTSSAEKIKALGITKTDEQLLTNGYDVTYKMVYDVTEDKDVDAAWKAAAEKELGCEPDLAIYFTSHIERQQTFGEFEKAELEGSYDVDFRCIPGDDEKLFTTGKYYLLYCEGDTAKIVDAGFSFNDSKQLVIEYKSEKRGRYVIAYVNTKPSQSLRISGATRYETAQEITDRVDVENDAKGFDNVIVASGEDFPDALSAAYLSKVKNAPILLTSPARENATAEYIKAKANENAAVYIIGGEGVISSRLEKLLTSMTDKKLTVKRLAGSDRYATNLAVLKETGEKQDEIMFASGFDFADAISASAAGRPLMLVSGDALTSEQQSYLSTAGAKSAFIIGGSGAVSEKLGEQVKGLIPQLERLGGKNRYETSRITANRFFRKTVTAALACGSNFPDGIAGAALAFCYDCPILLADNANYEEAAVYAWNSGVTKTVTFGGPTLISDETIQKITAK